MAKTIPAIYPTINSTETFIDAGIYAETMKTINQQMNYLYARNGRTLVADTLGQLWNDDFAASGGVAPMYYAPRVGNTTVKTLASYKIRGQPRYNKIKVLLKYSLRSDVGASPTSGDGHITVTIENMPGGGTLTSNITVPFSELDTSPESSELSFTLPTDTFLSFSPRLDIDAYTDNGNVVLYLYSVSVWEDDSTTTLP